MAKNKERELKQEFKFDDNNANYDFQLKKKANPWWLLLLLLPLVLLIPLKKDVTVFTLCDGAPEPFVDVSMSYTSRYLLWDKKFNVKIPCDTIQQTDSTGCTVFKDLGYSVFSFIFYYKAPIVFTAGGDCFDTISEDVRFHTTRKVELAMQPKLTDVRLKVVDLELNFEIPGALIECQSKGKNGMRQTTDTTDAAGCAVVKEARVCGGFSSIKVSADGYADTLLTDLQVEDLLAQTGGYVIPLRPLKERFIFFVKNLYTKQPIPNALAEVTLNLKGQPGSGGPMQTNVNGLGQGFYDEARVLATIDIKASKQGYNDSVFVAPKGKPNPIMVKDFVKLDSVDRVVWLRPKPHTEQFRNVDTLSGQPIPGVKNEIVINSIDGTTSPKIVSTSNSNGYFDVTALPGDKITIVSTLDPYYHPKTTVIEKFEKAEIIYMRPVLVSLNFRTMELVEGKVTGVLPDCDLVVTVDGKKVNPTNSGSGEFTVADLRLTSKISIVASKTNYDTNDTKIKDKSVEWLSKAGQDERDIPLEKKITLTFRTVDQTTGSLLAGCTFVPTGSISGKLKYKEKSPGVFDVTFLPNEKVSITASKPGYTTNSTKVKNASYSQLSTQKDRDIPLKQDWAYDYQGSAKTHRECYDLYTAPASFTFNWTICTCCTMLVIEDANGKVIETFGEMTCFPGQEQKQPSSGTIRLKSPTQKICVTVTDNNGCTGQYHIRP